MGPHPETPVDVQKYIGTCLITQQPRSKRKSCPRGVGQPPPHHPHKDGPGYVQGGCCTKGNGGFNSMTNYAWTGVPLISVARQGGKSHHSHPGKNRGSPPGRNSMKQQQQQQQQSQDYFESSSVVDGCLEEILPISRLAIHAQGAPLILSPKDLPGEKAKELEGYPVPFKGPDFYHLGSEGRLYMFMTGCCSPDDPLHLHPPPHQRGGGERTPSSSSSGSSCCYPEDDPESGGSRAVASSPSRSSDCGTSTTSEDSGTSENGLPRILKPRKRRKKDRRMSEGDAAHGAESQSPHQGTIVTLKPYQPLCYRYSGSGGAFKAAPSSSSSKSASASNKSSEGESGGLQRGAYPYPPSSRCRCPHCVPPPSTLLTPPDSPVAAEEGMPASARRKTNEFVVLPSEDTTHCADASLESIKSQNALVLTSSHPPPRPWIQVSNQSPQSSCSFTVMCYNILCDKYATRQMYGYCPNWALEWSYRKRNILNEIIHYKADIISLQEVETEQFYKYFLPELKKEGYDGIFSPKSRAKTMSEGERKHVDGCAIFYKTDKFFLLKEHLVEFNQLAMANAEGSDDMLNRVMTKDNIGLAALLQTRMGAYDLRPDMNQTSQTLLVCTAHIHWDPEYSDVKLIQTMMLMHELKAFVDDILHKCNIPASQKSDPNLIPLLLCGDFNSLPNSGVIEYLSSGRVSTSHIDFKEIAYKDCLSKLGNPTNSNEFTHPFQITRAYKDGIMPFTNYSYDFKGVIDYVFYSKLHMNVLGVLGPIDSGWLEENHIHGCPHPHVPSDHFPIVVELQLYPTTSLHPQQPPNGVSLHR